MKIKLTNDMKRVITIDKLGAIAKVNESMKEQKNLQWEAEQAVALATGYSGIEILKISAEIALNQRTWDYYGEGTEDIDVWIEVIAFSAVFGCYNIRFYLSDIWSMSDVNREEVKQKLYTRHFTDSDCI